MGLLRAGSFRSAVGVGIVLGAFWSRGWRAPANDLLEVGQLAERGALLVAPGSQSETRLRSAVGVGDVDGDGFGDLLISMGGLGDARDSLVSLIYGRGGLEGALEIGSTPQGSLRFRSRIVLQIPTAEESPAAAGDWNQDGLADYIFGLPYYPDGEIFRGEAFLVFGGPRREGEVFVEDIGTLVPGITFRCSDPSCLGVGRSAAALGDFNGDGFGDLAVSAPFFPTTQDGDPLPGIEPAGRIFVLYGGAQLKPEIDLFDVGGQAVPGAVVLGSTLRSTPVQNSPERAGEQIGVRLTPAGDIDGDGFADFFADEQRQQPWTRYLIHGNRDFPAVLDLNRLLVSELPQVTTFFGTRKGFGLGEASGAGDVTGDGTADIAVGFWRSSFSPFSVSGNSIVTLFPGAAPLPARVDMSSLLQPPPAITFHALSIADRFGASVAPVGDVNSDGIADLAVGAPSANVLGRGGAGEAYVFFGRRDFTSDVLAEESFQGIRLQGDRALDNLGDSVAPAGDFNGDGSPDWLAIGTQAGASEERSRIALVYGSSGADAPLRVYRTEPAQGRLRGGVHVRILGSGFSAVPSVRFGGRPSGSVRLVSSSEVTAILPPGDVLGLVDVTVEFPRGEKTLSGGFEYVPDFPLVDLDALGNRGVAIQSLDPSEGQLSQVAALGDWDADGIDDLAFDGASDGFGACVTVLKGSHVLPLTLGPCAPGPEVWLVRLPPWSSGVVSIAFAGDLNGDGRMDLAIGTARDGGFIVLGRAKLPPEISIEEELIGGGALHLLRGAPSACGVSRAGDQTGDGIDDLALVFPSANAPGLHEGEIVFIEGRANLADLFVLDTDLDRYSSVRGTNEGESLGDSFAVLGDVTSDGVPDFLASTRRSDGKGRAYVILGGSHLPGDEDIELLELTGDAVAIHIESGFGSLKWINTAAPGDIDGDGIGDLLLGVEGGGESNHGVVYVVPGSKILGEPMTLREAPEPGDGITRYLGPAPYVQAARISPAGDLNHDGFADFLIAAQPDQATLPVTPWQILVALGGPDLPPRIDFAKPGRFGFHIDGRPGLAVVAPTLREPGDLNGDGDPDLVFSESSNLDGRPPRIHVLLSLFGGAEFLRGDANFDGRIEISDAVFLLGFLFLGGESPRCADAADADDSGELNLTDAIFLLNHLFLGGREPPEPHAARGRDETVDGLDCRGF